MSGVFSGVHDIFSLADWCVLGADTVRRHW